MAEEKFQSRWSDNLVTPVATLSFPYLDAPDTEGQYSTGKYGCTLLIPKDADLSAFREECLRIAKEMWGVSDLKGITLPFNNGDDKEYESFHGNFFMIPKSNDRPNCFFRDKTRVAQEDIGNVFYSGCKVRAVVALFTYTTTETLLENGVKKKVQTKGITSKLRHIQFYADGPRLSGGGDGFDLLDDGDGEDSSSMFD